jgi:hypothetical protein
MSTYKLLSYNTSWVNDASINQLHPGLSESASIVAKAIALERVGEIENNKLADFRMELADQATTYIKEKIDSGYDFIALVEQTIHVPKDSHANYDSFSKKWTTYDPNFVHTTNNKIVNNGVELNYNVELPLFTGTDDDDKVNKIRDFAINPNKLIDDLNKKIDTLNKTSDKKLDKLSLFHIPANQQDIGGDDNNNYGILRRIGKLGLNDISVKPIDPSKPYSVVYDQIINPTIPTGPGGEGIGIAFKTTLVDTLLEWNQSTHPVRQRLVTNNYGILGLNKDGTEFNGSLNEDKNVHYYSDDMGDTVCYDANRTQIYYNATGTAADLGRPIIMTAGVKDKTLQIFVALHGPNVFNMTFESNETNKEGKKIKKQIKEVLNDSNEYATYKTQVDNIFIALYASLGKFIQKGLESATNGLNKPNSILNDITTVNLFLGGDANDPRGQLLESIIKDGISLNINTNIDNTIKFNYNLGERRKAENGDVSQYGYKNLLSCCGNNDSILQNENPEYSRNRPGPNGKPPNGTGPIILARVDYYPKDFYKPENFGYNGDYVLFGCSTNPVNYMLMLDDKNDLQYYNKDKKIIASDHLPVISSPSSLPQPPVSTPQKEIPNYQKPTFSSLQKLPQKSPQKPLQKSFQNRGGKTKKRSNKSKSKKRVSFGGRRTRKNNNKTRKNRH